MYHTLSFNLLHIIVSCPILKPTLYPCILSYPITYSISLYYTPPCNLLPDILINLLHIPVSWFLPYLIIYFNPLYLIHPIPYPYILPHALFFNLLGIPVIFKPSPFPRILVKYFRFLDVLIVSFNKYEGTTRSKIKTAWTGLTSVLLLACMRSTTRVTALNYI